jgi:lauroyl/myristoyl acyltransferase
MRIVKSKDFALLAAMGLMLATRPPVLEKFRGSILTSLGKISVFFSRSRASDADRNLATSMGAQLSAATRRQIVEESFMDYWREIFSLLHSYDKGTRWNVAIDGIDNLREALRGGKGAILWQPAEFGRRNFVNQYLSAHGFSLSQVHAEYHIVGDPTHLRNLTTKPFFTWCSRKFLKEIIWLPDSGSLAFTRLLVKRLQGNAIVSIAGDARASRKNVPVKFFGDVSYFPAGMFSLSKETGAPVLPVFCFEEAPCRICLVIEPPLIPLSPEHGDNLSEPVAECAEKLEHYIRRCPGQFRNWHQMYREQTIV